MVVQKRYRGWVCDLGLKEELDDAKKEKKMDAAETDCLDKKGTKRICAKPMQKHLWRPLRFRELCF